MAVVRWTRRCRQEAHGIRAHLFSSMLILGISILCTSSIVASLMICTAFYSQTSEAFQRSCVQFNRMLELRFSELGKINSILVNDANVQKVYAVTYSNAYDRYSTQQEVDKLLNNLFSRSNQIDVCFLLEQEARLYTNLTPDSGRRLNRSRFYFRSYDIDLTQIRRLPWYQAGVQSSLGAFSYIYTFSLPGFESAAGLALFQRIQYTGRQLGYLVLLMGNEWMAPLFEMEHSDENHIILSQSGLPLYATGQQADLLLTHSRSKLPQDGSTLLTLKGEPYLVYHQSSELYGLEIIMAQRLTPLFHTLARTLGAYLLVGVALAGVAVWLSARQSQKLTGPLLAITREIDAGPASFHLVPERGATREIHQLASCLNQMSLRNNLLVENMLDTHLMQKNAEICALKQQINPHFLYNVIETINSMAMIHGCDEICSVASHLGSMMRYALETDREVVPLWMELKHLDDFLAINRIHGTEFESLVNIEPALMNVPVPRLILQPLAENAFKHGFRGKARPWRLEVTAECRTDGFYLYIVDNGVGMTEEHLERVRRSFQYSRNDSESIGVYNVHRRIHLLYGEPFGLRMDSIRQNGTRITLHLPDLSQEKSHVKE